VFRPFGRCFLFLYLDCVSDNFDGDSFKEDYCNLLKISQSVSKTVVISGMCPRLDDRNGHITCFCPFGRCFLFLYLLTAVCFPF
jgi:hypothetical protein